MVDLHAELRLLSLRERYFSAARRLRIMNVKFHEHRAQDVLNAGIPKLEVMVADLHRLIKRGVS